MIWGETPVCAQIVTAVGDDPAIDQLLLCYDHPDDADASWEPTREGLVEGPATPGRRRSSPRPSLTCSTTRPPRALGPRPARDRRPAHGAALCPRAPPPARRSPAPARDRRGARATGRPPTAAVWLDEAGVKDCCASGGGRAGGRHRRQRRRCLEVARRIGWPVALKLSSPELRHKSEAGALALGIGDEDALDAPSADCAPGRRRPRPDTGGADGGARGGVGGRRAGRRGRAGLVVGLGGIWTEALEDVAVVPLPAPPGRVARALRSLRGAPLLTGGRGLEPVALDAAAELASRAGEVLLSERLVLLELNPVSVTRGRAVALDAVAVRASS